MSELKLRVLMDESYIDEMRKVIREFENEALNVGSVDGLIEIVKRWDQEKANLDNFSGEIEEARDNYATDECEIDDCPAVSEADNGVWVSAWVWVSTPEFTEEEDGGHPV